jgi:transcriptional regulator with XRE-family HTH domain
MPASRRKSEEMPGAIALARSIRGWTQAQLAKASGLAATSISDYERGVGTPTYRSLQRIAAALGVSVPDLLALASIARRFRGVEAPAGGVETPGDRPGDLPDLRPQLVALLRAEVEPAAGDVRQARRAELDSGRRRAPALWQRVEPLAGPERRALVLRDAEFHDAAFCELLCDQSVEAAGDSSERALELAELALLLARHVPGTEGWRSRLEGYAQAHVAGALLVGGHLARAGRAQDTAGTLWRAGAADDPGLLNESRVLALEASLRRAQRRLPEAQALLDQALAIDCWGETPSLLIAAAKAVEKTGDFE